MPMATRTVHRPGPSPGPSGHAPFVPRASQMVLSRGRAGLAAGLCLVLAACQTTPWSRDAAPAQKDAAAGQHRGASAGDVSDPGGTVVRSTPATESLPRSAATQSVEQAAQPPQTAASAPQDHGTLVADARSDLWGRMRRGMRMAPLTEGTAALRQAQHARWYEKNGEHMRRVFRRARLYMFDIVEAVHAEGLPMEVALLPAVESAFMPEAVSSAAADGLWQFIRSTGRRFGLKQHAFVDQRRDVRQATRAALAYLKELQSRYSGDMQLAMAAYNCGEGCIDAAVRRARARGLPGRFEDLQLTPETANYVPRLLALTTLVADAVDADALERHHLPDMPNAPYFIEVRIERDLDVALAARLAGQSEAEFRSLNPQHKKPVIVAQASKYVLVPIERKEAFEEALLNYQGQMASWTTYRVPQRSKVEAIAQRFGIDPNSLRRLNGIPGGHLVTANSTLLVPRRSAQQADISVATAEAAHVGTTPAMVKVRLKLTKHDVRKGRGWAVLARRLGVKPAQLKGWNPELATLVAGVVNVAVPLEVAERPRKPAPTATAPMPKSPGSSQRPTKAGKPRHAKPASMRSKARTSRA